MSTSDIYHSHIVRSLKLPSELRLILLAATAGLLLSAWRIYILEVVNTDGAAYLLAAGGDWAQAATFKNWNFYSMFMGWLSELTAATPEIVAHICGAIFDMITLVYFLRIIISFGGDRLVLLWGGIAFLSLTYFNDNRAEVIRDHGYWAAYMVGLWYFIRIYRSFSWGAVIGWTAAMLVASLFRIEGVIFLLLSPLVLFVNPSLPFSKRCRSAFCTWAPILFISIILFFSFGSIGGFQDRLMELVTSVERLYRELSVVMPGKGEALREHVFPLYKDEEAVQGVYAILGWGIVSDLIKGMSPLFFLILISRKWFPRPGLSADSSRIMWAFILINLAIVTSWMLIHQVMVARYVLGLTFVALIWVAFSLAHLHRRYIESEKGESVRAVFFAVIGIIAIMVGDSIIETGSSKTYIADAGGWIQENAPKGSRIGVNYEVQRLRYYANKGLPDQPTYRVKRAMSGTRENLDYLFLRIRKGQIVSERSASDLEIDMKLVWKIIDDDGNGFAVYGA